MILEIPRPMVNALTPLLIGAYQNTNIATAPPTMMEQLREDNTLTEEILSFKHIQAINQ